MDHLLSKEKECISKKKVSDLVNILFGFEGSVKKPHDRSLKTEQHQKEKT